MKIVHPLNFVEHFAHVTNTRTQFQLFTIVHVISRMRSSLKGVVKGRGFPISAVVSKKLRTNMGGYFSKKGSGAGGEKEKETVVKLKKRIDNPFVFTRTR